MSKANYFIDKLFLLLKREREIKSAARAVEVISLFILVRYIEVEILKVKSKLNHKWIENNKKEDFICYFQDILNRNDNTQNLFENLYDINKALSVHIEDSILKIWNKDFYFILVDFLLSLNSKQDFRTIEAPYNQLIEKMVAEAAQSGEFYTPKALSEVMVSYLKPKNKNTIYDPACGTSGFLVDAAKYIAQSGSSFNLKGCDVSSFALIISSVNLIISGSDNFTLQLCDSLDNTQRSFTEKTYDIVITNPPFGRASSNIQKNQYIDYQFLTHVMESLKIEGKAAVILPERFLYDTGNQAKQIKSDLLVNFNIDCILLLPSGTMLPYTGVKIIILFFSRTTPRGKVWLYDLKKSGKITRNTSITLNDFDDFLEKSKDKEQSDNSWSINIEDFDSNYNLLEITTTKIDYSNFTPFTDILSAIKNTGKELINNISEVHDNIENIRLNVSAAFDNHQFITVKVGDLVSSLKTVSLSKDKLLPEGNYEVYGGNGVIGHYNEYLHSGKLIIVGRVGALCGNVHYVEGKIWATNNAVVLKCTDINLVHPEYLARILSNKDLRMLATGTAQPHLTVERIKNTEIKLPPINIQIKIETWLSKLDAELKLQAELIRELDEKNDKLKLGINLHLLQV